MTYNPALDGLRAVAVLLVMLFHARVPGFFGGYVGVDIFFVLSGFLITSILWRELQQHGRVNLTTFYWRRALRLMPPLLAMVGLYMILAPMAWPESAPADRWRDAGLALFYLSDYSRAFFGVPDHLLHTWSLSIEEHFYLAWPLVLAVLARRTALEQCLALVLLYSLAPPLRRWGPVLERGLLSVRYPPERAAARLPAGADRFSLAVV